MARIKPRTATVTIYQGDDLARLAELDEAVDTAYARVERARRDATIRLLAEAPPRVEAEERLQAAQEERDEFAAEAETRGVRVVLTALGRRRWRDLVAEHPPRQGEENDEQFAVNIATFPEALLALSIVTTPVAGLSPESVSNIEGDVEEFLDSLSDYDYYDRLFLTAFGLNRGAALADPTLRLASEPSQTSPEISNSPKPGVSLL